MPFNKLEKKLGLSVTLHKRFNSISDDEVLHPEKIADLLGMSTESVRRWCRNGKLSCYSFGGKYVILGADFKEFMRRSYARSKVDRELLD